MQDNQLTISDLIDYLTMMLNFEIKGKLVYLDVVEELEKIPDLAEFRKEVKSRVSNLNDDYKYLNGFQKFTKIVEDYKSKKIVLNQEEQTKTYIWIERLYQNLTWYFDELAWSNPTVWQLDHHEWKNFKRGKKGEDEKDWKLLFNEKELKVCDKIGDTKEIYRLATKRKPELREKIETIVNGLIKESKVKALEFNNSNLKLLK